MISNGSAVEVFVYLVCEKHEERYFRMMLAERPGQDACERQVALSNNGATGDTRKHPCNLCRPRIGVKRTHRSRFAEPSGNWMRRTHHATPRSRPWNDSRNGPGGVNRRPPPLFRPLSYASGELADRAHLFRCHRELQTEDAPADGGCTLKARKRVGIEW